MEQFAGTKVEALNPDIVRIYENRIGSIMSVYMRIGLDL